ncbi:hypothetical protein UlMin_041649 [Ulmus minor]
MVSLRHLQDLQSQPLNKICIDCAQKNPQWVLVSYGIFMCLECSSKHRGLGIQIKKMESGGNKNLYAFLSQYGIPKETDIVTKYNTNATSIYQDQIQAIAKGHPWQDPPIMKANLGGSGSKKPLLAQGSGRNNGSFRSNGGWDNDDGFRSSSDIRRNQSMGNVRGVSGGGGAIGGMSAHSKLNKDIYTRSQLEASAANKESFFSQKMQENDSRPKGLLPSQGGNYVGFGLAPAPSQRNTNAQGDVFSVFSQVGILSLVAASMAQSAATAVQVGTQMITSNVSYGQFCN